MPLPTTIDEVITYLDRIIAESIRDDNPLGFFAALYQKVTIKVKEGIENNRFEDGLRMEQLDVVFANRYILAYQQYQQGQQPSQSWQLTFEQAENSQLIILQHLFLGMNAHINLDLGLAAAEIAPGRLIEGLKADFMEINRLLFEMIEEIQADISRVSPWIGLLDWIGKDRDEQLARFSMKAAREHAWLVAQRMAFVGAEAESRREAIQDIDQYVKRLGNMILNPGWLVSIFYRLIRLGESKNIKQNIKSLAVRMA